MRERFRPDDRRRHAAEARQRPPEPAPAASVLYLQRAAGNRAVSGLLARDSNKKDEPKKEERGSTMTLGLGDLGVIPLESATWREKESELDVTFVNSSLASKLHEAAATGKHFPSVFLSSWTMMSKMADVYVSNLHLPTSSGGEEQMITALSLNFEEVAHEPVK